MKSDPVKNWIRSTNGYGQRDNRDSTPTVKKFGGTRPQMGEGGEAESGETATPRRLNRWLKLHLENYDLDVKGRVAAVVESCLVERRESCLVTLREKVQCI
jgi:hypothetical protein